MGQITREHHDGGHCVHWHDVHCVMPPAPDLEEEIVAAKQRLLAGADPSEAVQDTRLDARSLTLILSRPAKTRAHTLVAPTQEFASVLGDRRALVLLVDFSDKAATQTQAHFNDMLFSSGTYATGSMRDFYRQASYNKLNVIGTVSGTGGPTAGWYRAPNPKTYYTNNNYGFGAYPQNAQRLVEQVVDLANPHVNFADFDNDGDGVVDALVIVCAGSGGEATANKNDFWSHKWSITPKTVDGVKVQNYFMAPEDGRVGVFSHELGHLLMAWPDLYDTDYSSAGTGRWDLMAGGSWNNGGNTPAHPVAWCKDKVGWVSPVVLFNQQQSVTIQPYASNSQVYKLPIGSAASKQYFLVSNRQQAGFDVHLPGEGCLIEHVDDNQSNNTDETHYLVDVEQADGKQDLNKNVNRGDATDPFPTSTNNSFTGSTTPSSKAYDGSNSNVSITNITRSGDNITADINVGGAAATGWHYNKKVTMTYAHHTTQWAWAYIDGLGWRRIKDGAADGVTNAFDAFCEAAANQRLVHVYADGTFVYTMYLA
jgi:immune inhibitor A